MQGGYSNCAERFVQQPAAADALQLTLRSRFRAWLRRGVRLLRETMLSVEGEPRIEGRGVDTNARAGMGTSGSPAPLDCCSGAGDEYGTRHRGQADTAP
jgi:hypothetical protein